MKLFKLILPILLIFFINLCAKAQQTIITIPSSSVLPFGEAIIKQSTRFRPFGNGQYVNLTPSMTLGTGKGTEIAFAVATKMNDRTNVNLDIAAKKVFYAGQSTRFTVGGQVLPSLTGGVNPDSFLFAHGSYLIKKTKTTITSGMYVAGDERMPNMAGVLIGLDQIIIPKKLRLVADWKSNPETGGAFAAGIKYQPGGGTSITTAIVLPNTEQDRIAFSVSISKYLGNIFEKLKKEEGEQL